MLPPTPPQTGLAWYIGDESTAAEFRQATRAWMQAYLRHEFADLTPQNWQHHKHQAHNVDVLFICMRLRTMARARGSQTPGPGPLRTRRWPWGLPRVLGTARDALESDNDWIRMALSAIKEVSSQASHPTILWTAPEDRGGDDASLWQLPELRQFATGGGWFRYAFHQCELTPAANPRPTAVLSLSPLRDALLAKGWPKLRDSDKSYLGPLDNGCKCGQKHEPWSKKPRHFTYTALEKGVLGRLLSIARKSGLAKHLRSGHLQVHQTPHSTSRSPSRSPSASSSGGSATTCISSPRVALGEEIDAMQWDDEAAAALGLRKRNQDSRLPSLECHSCLRGPPSHSGKNPGSRRYNWDIPWTSSSRLCAALVRGYAIGALLTA